MGRSHSGIPTVVVEEHNEAFYVWNHAIRRDWISARGNTLLHVDEHADMEMPRLRRTAAAIGGDRDLLEFTYEELDIASFILPAALQRIFNRILWMKHEHVNPGFQTPLNLVRPGAGGQIERTPLSYTHVAPGSALPADQPVLLDIDLDYFYCEGGPSEAREIEVTAECYREFSSNRYHFLRLAPSHRARGRAADGRYFLRFYANQPTQPRPDPSEQIAGRVRQLVNDLAASSVVPVLITICRSVHSGYTPRAHARAIELALIAALERSWNLDLHLLPELIPQPEEVLV